MLIRKLIIGLLSFYAVEVKRASIKDHESHPLEIKTERLFEVERKRETKKRKIRLYDKSKWKKKKEYKEKQLSFKGTNPKEVRFSNQRKIRRMFRNS